MIGTQLIEEFVQSIALSHLVKGHQRVSALFLAAPESGKTTITSAATATHVTPIAVITARSVVKLANDSPKTEFLLFNDLTSIRALSPTAVALLINLLNQITQGEKGLIGFAGKDTEKIERPIGVIGCLPFSTFADHRAKWREMGFVSRMIPFAYSYHAELVAEIKDAIDAGTHSAATQPARKMPKAGKRSVVVTITKPLSRKVRAIADARAIELGQIGIRLLKSYQCLVRAHALLHKRTAVTIADLEFLRAIDKFVSVKQCLPLNGESH